MEDRDVRERVVLVTGAGKGLGRSFALELLNSRARVAACSRTEDDLSRLREEARTDHLLTACLDVRDHTATANFVEAIHREWGRLDIAVINAGVTTENATVEDSDLDRWAEAVDVNLIGSMKTAKAVIPLMKQTGGGSIIFVGSGLGHRGLPGTSSYSCAKAGLWMLTRILAQELMEDAILVNELIPGPVNTEIDRLITQRHSSGSFATEWNKEPKDVLPLFRYMLSFPATGPTGQTFSLDRRDL